MRLGDVVVGVDGSPSARAALRWAARQARLTGGRLHTVTAWQVPSCYGWDLPGVPYEDDLDATAGKVLTTAVHSVIGDDPPDLEVVERVEPGHPAQVLIDLSARAGLLVVGSRGHSPLAGALIGSVSQQCVQHAHCPVVVVRGNP
ncbi:nucleotide-binding universal stress UspA family protein [Actinoplanes campanulatus]|uniref:Nucleotide-binding universal stress UspA family protein n=1 Tax=Actinoplanes campanulatus TaxID=113559 RepID=A0A7W5FJU0_9ACTN|nr:universal stress protein [Actinoplanes campanulatus]MBB3101094.1 nucleotide-binding universal stress UspA family protein [Actinoplanes campanulatus]GGN51805.1 universal stress protein [Actinoplanes campanulatus]GID42045.1 universal stress protein [Actinoplanes campanulatus]